MTVCVHSQIGRTKPFSENIQSYSFNNFNYFNNYNKKCTHLFANPQINISERGGTDYQVHSNLIEIIEIVEK